MKLTSKELSKLLHRIRVAKYKKGDPKSLVRGIVEEIKRKRGYSNYQAWELMVEYLAKWLVIHGQVGLACIPPLKGFAGLSLKKDNLYRYLDEKLDLFHHYVTAAKAKPWDYIGDLYMELGLTQAGQNMTPRSIVEAMIKMVYATEKLDGEAASFCFDSYRRYVARYYAVNHAPPNHLRPMRLPVKTQLDPAVGTGRFLFIASQMMPKAPLVLFGIEICLPLYRACLVNMAMFSNHPYSIICADSLRLDPRITGPSSPLWSLGNRWNPPDVSRFYAKPPPIRSDHFSLKAFTKLKTS